MVCSSILFKLKLNFFYLNLNFRKHAKNVCIFFPKILIIKQLYLSERMGFIVCNWDKYNLQCIRQLELKFYFDFIFQEHAKNACTKTLPCGHPCGGIRGEETCLPCLHGCQGRDLLKQDADDMCMICFTEALAAAPAVQVITCN